MNAKAEKIALFRYGLIATLVLEKLPRGEMIRRARELAAHEYDIPFSDRRHVSVDTLLHWAARYRNGGLDALGPQPRSDRGKPRVISPQLAQLIERLKRENPHRNGTTLLRELALVSDDGTAPLSESSLYRFLKKQGLTKRQLLAKTGYKKFEAEFANQIWQSDLMYARFWTTPVVSSPMRSSMPIKGWRLSWIVYARRSPLAAYPYGYMWTMGRSTGPGNWSGLALRLES